MSKRDKQYDALRTVCNRQQQQLAEIREALYGADYGSLPSDFEIVRMAHQIRQSRDKFFDQVRNTCARAEKAEAQCAELREIVQEAIDLRVKLYRHSDLEGDTDNWSDEQVAARDPYASKWMVACGKVIDTAGSD